MVGADVLPPSMIDYPLMVDWWPPSTAVAFIGFGGDVRRLRSRRIDRLWEHGPLSRMLEMEDEDADRIQHAAERLEKELKRGTVAARATRQRGYRITSQAAPRGRPSYIKIAPHEWVSLTDRSGSSSGLSTHFFNDPARKLEPEIEIDVLAKDGIPTLWNWEVRPSLRRTSPAQNQKNRIRSDPAGVAGQVGHPGQPELPRFGLFGGRGRDDRAGQETFTA